MNLPLLSRAGRWLLVLVLSTVGLLGLTPVALATHIRAGDIQATTDQADPRHFFFKLTLYTDATPGSPGANVDTPDADIFFGDGTYMLAPRRDKLLLTGAASDSYLNTYYFEHRYNGPGTYKVAFIGENRKSDLVNIPLANNQTFYIYTQVSINPSIPFNHSPVLNNPALNKGARQQVFVHNPGATDSEQDSLSYELRPSQQADLAEAKRNGNTPIPTDCRGFVYPNVAAGGRQVAYNGPPAGQVGEAPIFVQDRLTGTIVWNSPETLGDYNVAFVVKEWRRTGSRYTQIGEVVRDMQITVRNANNLRPILTVPKDICVVAGVPITKTITATDPNGDPLVLTAFGPMLPPNPISPAGSFTITANSPPVSRGVFRWTPSCDNIAAQPYQVVFKVTDIPPASASATPLADELSWRIRVVGPAPQNVRVTQQGTAAVLNWNAYACQRADARLFIYRKEGCTISPVDTCQTGIDPSSGFVRVTDVPISATTYTDQGLERGKTYSYRIYAQFPLPTGGAGLASREACITLTGKPAQLKNVTVDRTSSTNGQITVRWTQPVPGTGETFNSPRGYNLFRSPAQATPVFTQINTAPISFNDSSYVDQGLNTQDQAYVYRLSFFSNAQPTPGSPVNTEQTSPASSVRLETTPDPTTLTISLTWTHNVPWDNSQRPVTIYRREGSSGAYTQIATAPTSKTGGSYQDRGTATAPLRISGNYCYYVSTNGTYGRPTQQLINLSQEQCTLLREVPCTPVLKLKQVNCDSLQAKLFDLAATPAEASYTNNLSWTLGNQPTNCSRKITSYRLYYRPNASGDTAGTRYTLLATLTAQNYTHTITNPSVGAAGCYYVVAVDSAGTTSAPSNIECKDNCPLFLMPNIFTPNGDGRNDKLRPKVASPIRRTRFQVFNRWGVKIYESDADPLINWDGGGPTGEANKGPKVVEGVYYYLAEVEFADAANTKRTFKGWVEITR